MKKQIIDVSLESNFGIREHRKSWMSKHLPIGRPRDIISAIAAVIGGIISAILPSTAGFVILGTYFSVAGIAYGIAAGIVIAAVVGLTVWSMTGGKKGSGGGIESALEQNGQLINTRQASKPLPIIYGICRVGGNWVFSRPSATDNDILNTVITWGEGEIDGPAPAIDYSPLYSGTTLNDIHTGGEYVAAATECTCDGSCYTYTACSCDMVCDGTYA